MRRSPRDRILNALIFSSCVSQKRTNNFQLWPQALNYSKRSCESSLLPLRTSSRRPSEVHVTDTRSDFKIRPRRFSIASCGSRLSCQEPVLQWGLHCRRAKSSPSQQRGQARLNISLKASGELEKPAWRLSCTTNDETIHTRKEWPDSVERG